MPARLVFISGSKSGTAVDLGKEPITFGRKPDRTIVFLPDEVLVSSEHATLFCREDRYVLHDDDSRNGTFVNADPIREQVLNDGDVVQFGPGGPAARFVMRAAADVARTLDPEELDKAYKLIELTKTRTASAEGVVTFETRGRRTTRELLAIAQRRTRRRGRVILAVAGLSLLTTASVLVWLQIGRAKLERNLAEISLALAAERTSRSALEQDLAAVEAGYDSLRSSVRQEQERVARDPRVDADVVRKYSQGVALIVFTYGYSEHGGERLLRYAVDARGERITLAGPGGRPYPHITLGGEGPPLQRHGTATGFLIDSAGWLLTNRHVSQPWVGDEELEILHSRGLDVEGRLMDLRAYFPPGDQSFPLSVRATSEDADVALLRIRARVQAPALPLAPQGAAARPGDQLIFIGYPTGAHNLLFRVTREERAEILENAGDDVRDLIAELARRRLIQPLIMTGSVSDTTPTEVIHSAWTTVGGSGGPLIDIRQRVVAVHYAVVLAPNPRDPFRTQRAVPIRFAWDILPPRLRRAVEARE